MNVEHVEFLVEERSTEEFLRILLPKLLGGHITFEVYSYNGKHDILGKIEARLRGYRKWLPATWRIVVVIDRDDDDCHELKGRLDAIAIAAGLNPPSNDHRPDPNRVINRSIRV